MYKIPTIDELRSDAIRDKIIDKYCEIIGEEIKRQNKLGARELAFGGEPEAVYMNLETNELVVVLSGKKEYANNNLYRKCNYSGCIEEVANRFIAAGYDVKINVCKNRCCYCNTVLGW